MNYADGKNKVGRIFTVIAAVAAAAALILYNGVMNRTTVPYVMIIASLVIFVLLKLVSNKSSGPLPVRAITFLNASLMAAALITGINPMVNQLGFVAAGLDTVSTISSLIVFAVSAGISMLLNVVASFLI